MPRLFIEFITFKTEIEDFEPECPYCDRRYEIQIHGSKKGVDLRIKEKNN